MTLNEWREVVGHGLPVVFTLGISLYLLVRQVRRRRSLRLRHEREDSGLQSGSLLPVPLVAVLEDAQGRVCSDYIPIPDSLPTLVELPVTRPGATRVAVYRRSDYAVLLRFAVDAELAPSDRYRVNLSDAELLPH